MSGDKPEKVISFNPTAWQFVVWTVGKIVGALVIMYAFVHFVSAFTFNQELRQFHSEAKPAISNMVDEKIQLHYLQAIQDENIKWSAITTRNASVDQILKSQNEALVEINKKLDEIQKEMRQNARSQK